MASFNSPASLSSSGDFEIGSSRTCDLRTVREGITRKAFSGNGATIALHKLMPKHEPKPHKHTYEQIVYILAGKIRFHIGDKSVVLGPGGLLQIPPDVMHWGEVVGDEPVLNLDIFTPVREEYAPPPSA